MNENEQLTQDTFFIHEVLYLYLGHVSMTVRWTLNCKVISRRVSQVHVHVFMFNIVLC